jgi:hypothetical protein
MTNEAKLAGCDPDLVRKVLAVIRDVAAHGYDVRVAEGLRSRAQAAANWRKGRAFRDGQWVVVNEKAIVTRTQHSKHCTGKAADLAAYDGAGRYIKDGEHPAYTLIGRAAKAHGLNGGYQWGWDQGHVELP